MSHYWAFRAGHWFSFWVHVLPSGSLRTPAAGSVGWSWLITASNSHRAVRVCHCASDTAFVSRWWSWQARRTTGPSVVCSLWCRPCCAMKMGWWWWWGAVGPTKYIGLRYIPLQSFDVQHSLSSCGNAWLMLCCHGFDSQRQVCGKCTLLAKSHEIFATPWCLARVATLFFFRCSGMQRRTAAYRGSDWISHMDISGYNGWICKWRCCLENEDSKGYFRITGRDNTRDI